MIDKDRLTFIKHTQGLPDMELPADTYFDDFRRRIQATIGTVENICYTCQGGKNKSEWDEYVSQQFQTFRHAMLDIADEVGSLAEGMVVKDEQSGNTGWFRRGR